MKSNKSPKRGVVSTEEGTYSKSGRKYGTGHGKKAEYRDFTTGGGDRSMRAGKIKRDLKKANRKVYREGDILMARNGGMMNESVIEEAKRLDLARRNNPRGY